jgi:hypothetical protein
MTDGSISATAAGEAPDSRAAALWLAAAFAICTCLVILYPDSYQQDGGTHFLYARDSWREPWRLVDVWGRPLFTALYAIPALAGYPFAKMLTVLICVATAYQTWRLAIAYGFERPALAIPLLFLQTSFLLLSSETMTEPLFALVFVIALRLRRAHLDAASAVMASLLPLARPEGFFLDALWALWMLLPNDGARSSLRRARSIAALGAGVLVWWLLALAITRDPLFILHNWPHNWSPTEAAYGHGKAFDYIRRSAEILNAWYLAPFALGLVLLIARRRASDLTTSVLLLLVVHSTLWTFGLFGSAGYPRYFVCVAPASALIALVGWNEIAAWITRLSRALYVTLATIVLACALQSALRYVDDQPWSRDAWAIDEMVRAVPGIPVDHLIASQTDMCIRLRCRNDGWFPLDADSAATMARLRATGPGTVVFWDADIGPKWYKLTPADFEAAGFHVLLARSYSMKGRLPRFSWQHDGQTRDQTFTILSK